MYGALVALGALVGLIIGSFLNVVIYRVPRGESVVAPRSHCPRCDAPIRPWQNVPVVSYVALGGRCASCREPISLRYPLVEGASAIIFALIVMWSIRYDAIPMLPVLLYVGAIGIALTMIDIDVHRLPNAIVLPAYPVVAILLCGASLVSGDWWALARAAIGLGALAGFYGLLTLVYPAGMGMGDVKLAGVLGALLGYVGFGPLIVGAFAGFLFGAAVAIVLLVAGRAGRKTALPFGPFMVVGAAFGVVAGEWVSQAYWGLLSVPI